MKEGYIKKKSATIPFGYELSEIEGYLAPIQSELDVLHTYIKSVEQEEYSLRKALLTTRVFCREYSLKTIANKTCFFRESAL